MSVNLVSQRSLSSQNRDVIFEVFSFIQDRTRRLSTTSNLQIVRSFRLFTCLIANLSYSSCLLILTRFMRFMGFGSKEMTSVSGFFVCTHVCMYVCLFFFLFSQSCGKTISGSILNRYRQATWF